MPYVRGGGDVCSGDVINVKCGGHVCVETKFGSDYQRTINKVPGSNYLKKYF